MPDYRLKPGDVINNYRFEHALGSGAYGIVWQGQHQPSSSPVAIKVIDIHNLSERDVKRVTRETQIVQNLSNHKYVVRLLDTFSEDDCLFIVMELMSGGSLATYLRRQAQLDFALTLTWAVDLCLCLTEVHNLGIIHRDLKPHNLLLTSDHQIKLNDFGIAHLPESELTTAYQPGSPGYRSPEQEANQPVNALTDVYALCAIFFEFWTRRQYFRYRETNPDIIYEEMSLLFAENYPILPKRIRLRLIDTVLAGLRPVDERISLATLQGILLLLYEEFMEHAHPGKPSVLTLEPDNRRAAGLSLEEGIKLIPEGGTIYLKSGKYNLIHPLLVRKPVRLKRAGTKATIIAGYGKKCVVEFKEVQSLEIEGVIFRYEGESQADVVIINDGNINLNRCSFIGGTSRSSSTSCGHGLLLTGSAKGVATHCRLTENQGSGIFLGGEADFVLEGNICASNGEAGICYSAEARGVARKNQCSQNKIGIHILDRAQPILEENLSFQNQTGLSFEGTGGNAIRNSCYSNGKQGICVAHQAKPTLEVNNCYKNQVGIGYFHQASGLGQNNRCSANEGYGIQVSGQATPILKNNQCDHNKLSGIAFFSESAGEASENNCSNNSRSGITIRGQAQPLIKNNLCRKNKQDGISYVEFAAGICQSNDCSANGANGIQVDDLAEPTLQENMCNKNKHKGIQVRIGAKPKLSNNHCSKNEERFIYEDEIPF